MTILIVPLLKQELGAIELHFHIPTDPNQATLSRDGDMCGNGIVID